MIRQLLNINSVTAQIATNSTRPLIELHSQKAGLNIQREKGSTEINSKNISCQIDTSACQAEEGHKSTSEIIRESADEGMQSALEATGKAAEYGDMLMRIEDGGDAFVNIAQDKFTSNKEYGLSFIPSQKPVINWDKNNLQINITPDKLHFNWDIPIGVESNAVMGKVNIEMARDPQIDITYTGKPITFPNSNRLDVSA